MRIAIYHNLPSGGGKRALYEMTRRLANGHEIDVYTLSCAEHDFGDLRPHCSQHIVFPFDPLPLFRRPLGRLNQGVRTLDLLRLRALGRRIARQIDAAGYDVVFVHHCQYSQAPALLQFLTTPAVYYCQEPPRLHHEPQIPRPHTRLSTLQRASSRVDPLPALYHFVLTRMDRAAVRAASRVLTNSAYSRESLYRTYGLFTSVCYLGVDAERFRPLSCTKEPFVLSVGALNPAKGFDFLLRSLAMLDAEQRPPLVVVSNFADERERRYLEELAGQLGVSVHFNVSIDDEELVRLYSQALLTLYAPIMEPFGFVPIESMACGTPVVGVREGGVRETILHEETGLLTERDPRCFAEAVAALLSAPDRRAQMGDRGSAYVTQQWPWERCVRDLEKHFADVVQQSARNGNR